jgi:hypothetical protein
MPKPLGFFHPDFVKDFKKFPWWLRALMVVYLLFVITFGIIITT